MAFGKGRKPPGSATQPLPPVKAPEILAQHFCNDKPVKTIVANTTRGWLLLVPQHWAYTKPLGILFCPFCGDKLVSKDG